MANLGFILKESVMEATKGLSDADFRNIITLLFYYATDRVTVEEFELDDLGPVAKAIFYMEKPSIDYNKKKWKENSEKRRIYHE